MSRRDRCRQCGAVLYPADTVCPRCGRPRAVAWAQRGVGAAAKRIGAAAAAIALLAAAAVVPATTRIGPVVLVVNAGRGVGLHLFDIVIVAIALPLAVLLLRYVDRSGD